MGVSYGQNYVGFDVQGTRAPLHSSCFVGVLRRLACSLTSQRASLCVVPSSTQQLHGSAPPKRRRFFGKSPVVMHPRDLPECQARARARFFYKAKSGEEAARVQPRECRDISNKCRCLLFYSRLCVSEPPGDHLVDWRPGVRVLPGIVA